MKWTFRAMLCASVSPVPHCGHRREDGSPGLGDEECSPMYFISSSVAAGESCKSLCSPNQNAWQEAHTSMVTLPPRRLPSVHSVIGAVQLEHFIGLSYQASLRPAPMINGFVS